MNYIYYSVIGKTLTGEPFMKIIVIAVNDKSTNYYFEDVIDVMHTEYDTITINCISYIMITHRLVDMPNYILIER